jgi:hypothetical protein
MTLDSPLERRRVWTTLGVEDVCLWTEGSSSTESHGGHFAAGDDGGIPLWTRTCAVRCADGGLCTIHSPYYSYYPLKNT